MRSEALHPGRVLAVARNTFREAVRNRAFLGLLLFSVAFILSSILLSALAVVGEGARVVVDFGFFAVALFAVATAIVMGALLVYKELEKKTIYTIVSKPIHRYEFILGKYLGLLTILVAQVVALGVIWALVILTRDGTVTFEHAKGMLLVVMEVGLIAAVAMMFSAASNPMLTGLFTFGLFIVGRLVYLIEEMLQAPKGLFVDNPVARAFGEVVVAVFPDLSVFDVSQQVLLGVPVAPSYLLHAFVYASAYALFFLVVALFAFERRDFT
ncbi:MAG: ABC transporter permease [Deltaproteobacteria bacterium]|nr:ABC transporter permease [Deltaproteobacteria bacterium]